MGHCWAHLPGQVGTGPGHPGPPVWGPRACRRGSGTPSRSPSRGPRHLLLVHHGHRVSRERVSHQPLPQALGTGVLPPGDRPPWLCPTARTSSESPSLGLRAGVSVGGGRPPRQPCSGRDPRWSRQPRWTPPATVTEETVGPATLLVGVPCGLACQARLAVLGTPIEQRGPRAPPRELTPCGVRAGGGHIKSPVTRPQNDKPTRSLGRARRLRVTPQQSQEGGGGLSRRGWEQRGPGHGGHQRARAVRDAEEKARRGGDRVAVGLPRA